MKARRRTYRNSLGASADPENPWNARVCRQAFISLSFHPGRPTPSTLSTKSSLSLKPEHLIFSRIRDAFPKSVDLLVSITLSGAWLNTCHPCQPHLSNSIVSSLRAGTVKNAALHHFLPLALNARNIQD